MSALVVLFPAHAATASTEFEYALTKDGSTIEAHGATQAALLPGPVQMHDGVHRLEHVIRTTAGVLVDFIN